MGALTQNDHGNVNTNHMFTAGEGCGALSRPGGTTPDEAIAAICRLSYICKYIRLPVYTCVCLGASYRTVPPKYAVLFLKFHPVKGAKTITTSSCTHTIK